jgi:hypothetical protein
MNKIKLALLGCAFLGLISVIMYMNTQDAGWITLFLISLGIALLIRFIKWLYKK